MILSGYLLFNSINNFLLVGLVYNKLRLLDRASEGDQRVYIHGDVTLEIGPVRPK